MILPLYGSLPTTAADSAKLAWGEMGPRAAAGNPSGKSKRARRGKRPRPQSFTARHDDQRGAAPSSVASPSKQEAKRFRSSQALAADYKLAMARTSLAKRAIVKEPRIASRRHQLSTQELIEQARSIESSATALCAGIYRVEMPTRGLVFHGSTWSVNDVNQEVWNLFATSRCSHRGMQAAYDRGDRKVRVTIVERLGLFKESSHDPGFYAADPTALQSNNEVDRVEKRLQNRLDIYERKFMTARVRVILRAWRIQRLGPAFRSIYEHKCDLALRGRTAAAIQIQRAYRGHHARQTMRRLRDARAQTVIACLIRKVRAKQRVAHRHYERQREMAATTIQCAVRKRQARHRLQIARQQRHIEDSAFMIQHAWKNYLAFGIARQAALARRQDRAARHIAGFMRIVAAKSRLAHLRLERAALRVQTRWRGFRGQVLAHFRRVEQEERHDAAITIQGMVRGRQARHVANRLRHARRERCAIRIQARWRARHAQLAYFLIQRERTRCARVIQRFYKAFAIQIALRNRQRDLAARRIQRAYRAKLRRIFNAARSIQRAWRFHKWYTARKSGAIRVQTFVRCVQTRTSYAEKRSAAMVIQRAVRVHAAHCMLSALRERRERLQGMPLCDECNDEVCGFYCRACQGKFCKACMRMIHSVLRDHEKAHLQSSVGVIFAVEWTRDHIAAAIRVQRAWRRRIVRIIDLAEKYKISRRQNALMMAGMRWRLRVKRSRKARVIQALFRGHRARKLAAHRRRAAIQIQAAARGFLCRLSFLRYRDACTRLQAHQRGRLARRQYRCQREAIVKIQSVLRAWDERGWFLEQRGAAISIQTTARRWRTQASFLAKRRAAIRIQASARGHFVRSSLRQKHAAATRIQALVRCFILRRAYQQKRAAAVRVQTVERGHRVRVAVHEKKGFIAAVNIAERRGRYRCAVKIQTAYRLHVARERAALKIQSAWRRNQGAYAAYLVRIGRTAAAANQDVGQIDASDRRYVDNNEDDDDDDGLECIWSRHWDSWNEVHFYFHKESFETTFQKPSAYAEAESEREARRCMLREEMYERKFMLYEREQDKQRRLENDWSVHVDPESGAKYYENVHLGISTWDRPEVLGPDPDEPLWKMYLHPALNRPFYVHRDTQEATWERPVEELGYEYTECWDFESSQPYWVSSVTGEWTYERPDELVPDAVKGKSLELSEDERQQALDNEANRQWFEAFDEESGRPYYYCWNAFTQTTEEIVWDKPDALKSAHDLWDEYYSAADQASYYVHKQTGETTWKKPW